MEDNKDKISAAVWAVFTAFMAVSLAVNGILSLMGKSDFAWWHLATLAISSLFLGGSLSDTINCKDGKEGCNLHCRDTKGRRQPSGPFKNTP